VQSFVPTKKSLIFDNSYLTLKTAFMKKIKRMSTALVVGIGLLSFIGCSTESVDITTKENPTNLQAHEERIDPNWKVQVKGTTIDFNDSKSYPTRYVNDKNGLYMFVDSDDPTTPNSKHPRTELRSTSPDFDVKPGASEHKMQVNMQLLNTSTRVVVGQLFSNGIGSDFIEVYLDSRKLYTRSDRDGSKLLNSNVGDTFSFTIVTKNGISQVWSNGNTFKTNQSTSGCYFKTGAYLLDGGNASVRITNLVKY
jgi:Alginate lyase